MKRFVVYILASRSRALYTGVTSDLAQRVADHQAKAVPGFTARYNTTRLVYVEPAPNARTAIAREKQIKGWRRARKVALIESQNPDWADLAETLLFR